MSYVLYFFFPFLPFFWGLTSQISSSHERWQWIAISIIDITNDKNNLSK